MPTLGVRKLGLQVGNILGDSMEAFVVLILYAVIALSRFNSHSLIAVCFGFFSSDCFQCACLIV